MSKRTKITLFIYLGITVLLYIYLQFFHVDQSVQALLDSGIRIVYADADEMQEALQTDGQVYAYGEMVGSIDLDRISFDALSFQGDDKEAKVEHVMKLAKSKKKDFVQLEFHSEQIKKIETGYEEILDEDGVLIEERPIYENVGISYDDLIVHADSFELLGEKFPLTESMAKDGAQKLRYEMGKGKLNEHLITYSHLDSGSLMWVDFQVKDGAIDPDTVVLQGIDNSFDQIAKGASGNASAFGLFMGILAFNAILFGITMAIQRKIFD